MGRLVNHTNIASRAARAKLAARAKPYWFPLDQGLHLGYRKLPGGKGGSWIVRRRRSAPVAKGSPYREQWIGVADDFSDAPKDIAVIAYSQAQAQARAKNAEWLREEEGLVEARGDYTVKEAMTDYFAAFTGKAKHEAEIASNAHILPELGAITVKRLTTRKIRQWLQTIAETPPRVRSRKGEEQRFKNWGPLKDWTPDQVRKRRATANRVLTILKAALNHAWEDELVENDSAWRKVKPFEEVDVPAIRYIAPDECVRLLNACAPDFRKLALGAVLSGCRYSELARMVCTDFSHNQATVLVRFGKGGRSRTVYLTDEGREFFSQQVVGKNGDDAIFTKVDGGTWGKGHQKRPLDAACAAAKITPRITFHGLRHFHGSALASTGVSMKLIAQQLGHADTRITERHYASLAPGAVAEAVRANFPTLGVVAKSKVRRLAR